MVAPVFTDEELEALRRFPEIGRDELARFSPSLHLMSRSLILAGAAVRPTGLGSR